MSTYGLLLLLKRRGQRENKRKYENSHYIQQKVKAAPVQWSGGGASGSTGGCWSGSLWSSGHLWLSTSVMSQTAGHVYHHMTALRFYVGLCFYHPQFGLWTTLRIKCWLFYDGKVSDLELGLRVLYMLMFYCITIEEEILHVLVSFMRGTGVD